MIKTFKSLEVHADAFNHADPFSDLDEPTITVEGGSVEQNDPEIHDLVHRICGSASLLYEDDTDDVPTCFDIEHENWQDNYPERA